MEASRLREEQLVAEVEAVRALSILESLQLFKPTNIALWISVGIICGKIAFWQT